MILHFEIYTFHNIAADVGTCARDRFVCEQPFQPVNHRYALCHTNNVETLSARLLKAKDGVESACG